MLRRMRLALRQSYLHFKRDREGSVAATFALALIPLVGLVGAAVDYSSATNARTSLQVALDAALIAGAKDGSTNWATTALNSFSANLNPSSQRTSVRRFS